MFTNFAFHTYLKNRLLCAPTTSYIIHVLWIEAFRFIKPKIISGLNRSPFGMMPTFNRTKCSLIVLPRCVCMCECLWLDFWLVPMLNLVKLHNWWTWLITTLLGSKWRYEKISMHLQKNEISKLHEEFTSKFQQNVNICAYEFGC